MKMNLLLPYSAYFLGGIRGNWKPSIFHTLSQNPPQKKITFPPNIILPKILDCSRYSKILLLYTQSCRLFWRNHFPLKWMIRKKSQQYQIGFSRKAIVEFAKSPIVHLSICKLPLCRFPLPSSLWRGRVCPLRWRRRSRRTPAGWCPPASCGMQREK